MNLLATALTTPAMIYYTPSNPSIKTICLHGTRYERSTIWIHGGHPQLWVQVTE